MRIKVKLCCELDRKVNSKSKNVIEMDDNKTVRQLLETIGISSYYEVIVVSGMKVLSQDRVLEDGDEISIYTCFTGG